MLLQGLGLNTHPYLLARWGTQRDLSLLSSIIYTGFSLGVMVAHPLISTLCLYGPFGGWPSSFYLLGLLSSCLTLTAAVLLHNSPIKHPFISEAELRYVHPPCFLVLPLLLVAVEYKEEYWKSVIPKIINFQNLWTNEFKIPDNLEHEFPELAALFTVWYHSIQYSIYFHISQTNNIENLH